MTSFTAMHVVREHVILLSASSDELFPLFDPIGEKQWASDWQPEVLYPLSGAVEEGMVFTTSTPADTIWVVEKYDSVKRHITYLRVTPGSHVGILDIRCEEAQEETTRVSITYTFTALTEQGNSYIAGLTEEHYREWISSWRTAIEHFLRHGQPLLHH